MTNLLKGHEDFIVSHTRENIRQICADNEEQQENDFRLPYRLLS